MVPFDALFRIIAKKKRANQASQQSNFVALATIYQR
jgi:hypothetical protein